MGRVALWVMSVGRAGRSIAMFCCGNCGAEKRWIGTRRRIGIFSAPKRWLVFGILGSFAGVGVLVGVGPFSWRHGQN